MGKMQLIAGRGNPLLAKKIAQKLRLPLTPVQIQTFADGEIYVRVEKKVRDDDIFIIQSMSSPVNENLMELLVMIDALKRASAGRINVVAPYLAYCRQDRKVTSREPITAKLVANLITQAGADRLVTVDLHSDPIQGFYDIPVDHLVGYPLFARYLLNKKCTDLVVVAPDVGGVKKATKLATLLHAPLVVADKRRKSQNLDNHSEVTFIIGEVKGKTAVIVDDMIDTGGTITNVAHVLKEKGASEIIMCSTHALLNKDASQKIAKCPATKVLLLDTLEIPKEKKLPKMKQISLAPLLAETIKRIHSGKSLGALFKWEK
jgi:ribose-phosphate pyrophosphokinase